MREFATILIVCTMSIAVCPTYVISARNLDNFQYPKLDNTALLFILIPILVPSLPLSILAT